MASHNNAGRGGRARVLGALALLATLLVACAPGAPSGSAPATGAGAARAASAAPTPTNPASGPATPTAERVTLAVSARSLSFLPQFLARSLGYYEREGLDVDLVTMRSDLQVAGMLSGELDYSCTGGDPVALAVVEGAPLRTILVAFDATHFTLVGQKGMTPAQLKGGRIGASRLQSVSHLIGRAMVSYLGFDPDADVTFFSTGETATSFAALEAGNIDAAVLSPPFSSELVSQGYAALAHASDLPDRVPFTGLTASVDHLRAKPEQAVRMSRAVLRALEVVAHDKPRVVDVLAKEWDVAPEAAEAVYDEVVAPIRPDGRMSDAAVQQYLDRIRREGLIKTALQPSDVMDFSYLERAARGG
ncbi:MAG TPA: ABC transporter substrate-binding protein [Chloroflexota bacterium]|nr:ABC transporter substrate-binding protein [Chloroflexota bacterium]